MRRVETQSWPPQVSGFVLPKQNLPYRLVSVCATIFAAVQSKQFIVAVVDGAGGIIMAFATQFLPANATATVSFSACGFAQDSSIATVWLDAGIVTVEIPGDLWIQPGWEVQINLTPNDATDTITSLVTCTEDFPRPGAARRA